MSLWDLIGIQNADHFRQAPKAIECEFKSCSGQYLYLLSMLLISRRLLNMTPVWFDLVWFYGISTIVGCLMPNPLYTYILNIYDLVCLGFMAYQPL